MSVRQRTRRNKDGQECKRWMVDIDYQHPDGRRERIRQIPRVQTRRAAEQLERELLNQLAGGGPRRAEVPLLEDFAKEFVTIYATVNNKPSEVDTKRDVLDQHLVPHFKGLRLDAIDLRKIEAYKASKLGGEKPLSPKTINNHLTVLRKLLDVAVEWKRLSHVPKFKWLKVPKPRFDFFDFDEAERLIAGAAPEWRCMITLGLRTGLRIGELLALRWEDVDLRAAHLNVRQAVARGRIGTPKGGRSREVPLSPQALDALKAHRHLRSKLVFCDPKGELLARGECKWPLWSASRRAGLRQVGWHVLRHTFASHLVMRGVSLKAVQELMGHATIEMTMRYAHLAPSVHREAVALLDGAAAISGRGTLAAP